MRNFQIGGLIYLLIKSSLILWLFMEKELRKNSSVFQQPILEWPNKLKPISRNTLTESISLNLILKKEKDITEFAAWELTPITKT
jgi:hypothetical protein